MKEKEINGDLVAYYFKDEQGNTLDMKITPEDETCIGRDIDRGKDSGKMIIKADVTLFWKVEF